jgi:dTDP-4-amino-4,6-dideoxygalactose transaminase
MYGNQRAWTYYVKRLGFRYHMANLHAAIGLAQLKRMDEFTARRQEACKRYSALLVDVAQVRTPLSDFSDVTPFLYYIRVPAEHRQPMRDYLKEQGIDTGIHWQPGHWFSLLSECRRGDLSVTENVGNEVLSLPLSSTITDAEIDLIANTVGQYFGNCK